MIGKIYSNVSLIQKYETGILIAGFQSLVSSTPLVPMTLLVTLLLLFMPLLAHTADFQLTVEVEEDVYSYTHADNGSGPLWCIGSTSLVRVGDRLFASGVETIPGIQPLNNCRWMLFERKSDAWERVWLDKDNRTREPSPMVAFSDGRVFVSANPTLAPPPDTRSGGPAEPQIFQFQANQSEIPPKLSKPRWAGEPQFTEHSYRSFAADGERNELILFQNIGYTHSEWSFYDAKGEWSAQGQLKWPWGSEYEKPQPIRICYPNVILHDKAVYFFGVSDIVEPNLAWREYKRELTGKEWDYDFRRMFFTWTPDITKEPFRDWVEIASREETCGWTRPGDLYLAKNGDLHLLWTDKAIDERLREKFFPDAKQSESLRYTVIRDGAVIQQKTITASIEGDHGIIGTNPRFQVTPEGRLFICYYVYGRNEDRRSVSENRICEILPDSSLSAPVSIPFQKPFTTYFIATVRAGSPPSSHVELLGQRAYSNDTISYGRVRIE